MAASGTDGVRRVSSKRALVRTIPVILVGVIAGLVVFVGFVYMLLGNISQRLNDRSHAVLESSRESLLEREAVLADMAGFGTECSDFVLWKLRHALLSYPKVHDILIFAGEEHAVSCSAVEGHLKTAQALPEPLASSATGRKTVFWRDAQSFYDDVGRPLIIVRNGAIGVVLTPTLATFELPETMRAETYTPIQDGKRVFTYSGDRELYPEFAEARDIPFFRRLFLEKCFTDPSHYCVLLHKPVRTAVSENAPSLVFGGLLSLGLAFLVAFSATAALRYRNSVGGRVLRGLKRGGSFSCNYQPIVDLKSGRVIGCEVLARFRDARGSIPPDEFIPVIESAGRTWEFSEIIFTQALSELWPLVTGTQFHVALNFFPQDLQDSHLERLKTSPALRALHNSGINMVCEILETGIQRSRSMGESLDYMKQQGWTIALDDFGCGYANLSQLAEIKVDIVKIDKSFIKGASMNETTVRSSIVPQIVEIARRAELDIVAEGIETSGQLEFLRSLDIKFGQGYHFGRPVDIETLRPVLLNEVLNGIKKARAGREPAYLLPPSEGSALLEPGERAGSIFSSRVV